MKKAHKNQLRLFTPEIQTAKKITYNELSIHEKINYRANQGMFAGTVYLNHYYYYRRYLHKPVTDRLCRDYFDHYRINAGGFNRLDTHLKSLTRKSSRQASMNL